MIELFNLLNTKRSKSVRIKCERLSLWKSDASRIAKLVEFIKDNLDLFYLHCFKIEYDNEKNIKAFDISFDTDDTTYDCLYVDYMYIFEKYHKDTISIDSLQFVKWNRDLSKLKLH